MSSLRAHAKTRAPDGRQWEIYAYRQRVPLTDDVRFHRIRSRFAPRAREWTIEAVSWAPYPIRHRWETSAELKGQALARVEGQLARGEQPQLRNAKQLLS